MSASPLSSGRGDDLRGVAAGFFAFTAWGLLPVYWKQLQDVPPLEILCHRILWSLVFVGLALTVGRGWGHSRALLKEPRKMGLLVCSGLVLGANWLIYIAAVNTGHVLESSLGYFITPLVNVLFGALFFRERPRRLQLLALLLALAGVALQLMLLGRLPVVALSLALTFGTYGLLRKIIRIDGLTGLFAETLVLALPALAYLLFLQGRGTAAFGAGPAARDLLLVGTGVVTSIPLVAFAFGTGRLRLTTIGFLQYLSPTISFLLGFFLYHEPLEWARLVTFALIWVAIALYSAESLLLLRRPSPEGRGR
ncbi:EamA family transporter RarD [Aminithiophilus ramosus]|uniref:EamA family transporter RarD n=1 Tax=Aminithiophilus ramosus TaxID=3029084 RepID=A0A9Q7AB92_9BACT|nr:EamA family transporter RarD [Aminithiophilus ramosus]QTX33481.1 EamA family transporter RarD [Aminithiophilus ramosus]